MEKAKETRKMKLIRKDILEIFGSTIILLGLEAVFFLWTPYHKGILFPLLNIDTYNIVGDILIRVVFYALYFVELYILLFKHIISSDYPFFNRNPIKLFLRLTFFRIIFDVFNLLLFSLTGNIAGAVITILTELLFLFLCFYQISSFITDKQFKLSFDKISIIFISAIFLLLCFSGIYFLLQYNKYCYLQEKYIASSKILNAFIENLYFRIELASLVIISVFTVLCFVYFYFTFKGQDYVKTDKRRKKGIRQRSDNIGKVLAVISCVIVLWGVEFAIYPLGSFTLFPDMQYSSSGMSKDVKTFGDEYVIRNFGRMTNYEGGQKTVFHKAFINIECGNKSIIKFSYYLPLNDDISYSLRSIDTKYTKKDELVGRTNVERYGSMVIVFIENDKPHTVKTELIKYHKENDILTEAIKSLISDGYWDYFEYGCDYLLKYEPEFIQPYIERYSNGDFTESELELNSDIKPEYITEFAKGYTSS